MSSPRRDPAHPNSPLNCVAYVSVEYMLSEAGQSIRGLGKVAGDRPMAARDIEVPVAAVGLLDSQGAGRRWRLSVPGCELRIRLWKWRSNALGFYSTRTIPRTFLKSAT
jgi:hypothetical protein